MICPNVFTLKYYLISLCKRIIVWNLWPSHAHEWCIVTAIMCSVIFQEATNISDNAKSIVRCLAKDELEKLSKCSCCYRDSLSPFFTKDWREPWKLCLDKRCDGESSNQRVPNTAVEFQRRTNMFGVTVFSSVAEKQVCCLHSLKAKIMQISLIGVTRSTGIYRRKNSLSTPWTHKGQHRCSATHS
jgi:hypothetical protein